MSEVLQQFAQYLQQLTSLSHLESVALAFIIVQGLFAWNVFRAQFAEREKPRLTLDQNTKDPA